MVKEASILNGSFAANAQFILSNADQLPFGDGSFDKVFTVNTIYFWGDAQRTFTEIQRVLKPDGILIVSLRPKSIMDKLPVVKFGFTTFSKEDIIKLIEENDYKMLSATESADIDLTIDEQTFKNSFLIIKAKKIK
jgi:ubiquinone/menaquinone biosynthesis C-methylase UbiE